jgi:hypothetical protein
MTINQTVLTDFAELLVSEVRRGAAIGVSAEIIDALKDIRRPLVYAAELFTHLGTNSSQPKPV